MKLLMENELVMSAVVANNRMNRERNATGVNSYENDLSFHPEQVMRHYLDQFGHVKWMDLCCGEGKALLQSAVYLAENSLQHRAALIGVDLIDGFQSIPENVTCLQWQVGSVVNWIADDRYDIITCVHGLHYVGDKLSVIQKCCKALTEQGFFQGSPGSAKY
ncbi:class I SAM-dependent methyltransferase [Pseudoflavitalea sp. G-6-1-2]|uniref:class I SAM-dependent methyltransferase n=1 Tax=Pseudoflavitalea sp. G-6-1-2 TaxID=2728841 RepID=UPI001F0DAE42|nr:class I SAM-dependent methyltransferase [Pseudoflavitalea sp. G-6-1-2]